MTFPPSLTIPGDVLDIVRTLAGAGHEAWCVGGALRDTLLEQPNTDYDIATSATPEVVRGLFKHTVAVGERFGTIAVRVRRRYHEVTTFRRDVQTDGRHAVVEFGASLADDLARRDFTINAIAYHPVSHDWRDPYNGAADLGARLIRAVGDPAQRFAEDYLRILRALRFAARFDFTIEPATWAAAQAAAPGLSRLSAERVRDEWFKGLRTARSLTTLLELWITSGAARAWLPELLPEGAQAQQAVVDHRAAALALLQGPQASSLARDPVLLTSLLCGNAVAVLTRLKASNAEIGRAAALRTGPAAPNGNGELEVRRWMAAVGDATDDLSTLWQLRHGTVAPWTEAAKGIRERGEALTRKQLAIGGNDLRDLGVPAGPEIGAILDRLLGLVVDDPSLNTRDSLIGYAGRLR